MDQTPVFFTSHSKQTSEMGRVKRVTISTSTQYTRLATLAMTVCADGTKLPPMLIFNDEKNGRIAAKEFPMFPTNCEYFCQDNAWMEKGAMLEWVENILKLFIATAPENVIPLLMLDSYQCHMMALVIGSIQNLVVEVEHNPGGCTSLCQPVDVGMKWSLNTNIHEDLED